jgi:hypothetical protein
MTCMATKSLPRRHLRDEQSVGWTPSEDAAMVQASVEVTMVDDLDLDVENAETETASSTSVAGVSVGKRLMVRTLAVCENGPARVARQLRRNSR